MRITVLAENTPARGLPAEHGLSLFVETEERRFLFDMGRTDLFARNAGALGIDLNTAEFAVLSHGHNDHGGGLETFLARNDHAPVYLSPYAFEPHFNAADRDIGLDPALRDRDRLVFADGETPIAPGITLYSCRDWPKLADFGAGGLQRMEDGVLKPEDFRHEQYLLAEEGGRRVLFSGCSHRGILNIAHWFRPDVLVGGFHFFRLPLDETLAGYARALDALPTVWYTCHCTGTEQFAFLRERMGSLHGLRTGDSVVL